MMVWRSAFSAALSSLGRTLERGGRLLAYAAAGSMSLADLHEAIQRGWRGWQEAATEAHGFSGLMQWEKDFYLRFLKPDDLILVVGCGTGRDLLGLLDLGYRVEGVDLVPESIEALRGALIARRMATDLYTGSIESVSLPKRYDAFIFSWFCYSFIPQSANRIAVLRKLRALLNPAGRILISYPRSEALPRTPIRLARLTAILSRSDWRPEYGDSVSLAPGAVFYEHRFPPGALEQEARAAGLTVAFHERKDSYYKAALTAA